MNGFWEGFEKRALSKDLLLRASEAAGKDLSRRARSYVRKHVVGGEGKSAPFRFFSRSETPEAVAGRAHEKAMMAKRQHQEFKFMRKSEPENVPFKGIRDRIVENTEKTRKNLEKDIIK